MKEAIVKVLPPRLYAELKYNDFKHRRPSQYNKWQEMRTAVTENGYSYKPFDDKQAIFIHVPKCAGVSINRILFGNLAGGHTTLEEYSNIFEPSLFFKYYKFTFVRNPWDRLVSAYHFLKQGGFNEQDKKWFDNELYMFQDFDSFVKAWLNKENIWKYYHFIPQHHYVYDKRNKFNIDFIGFFENIENDFNHITNQMGVDAKLPLSNKGDHDTYLRYYSDQTLEIVNDVYAEDIRLFGYEYNNSSLSEQLLKRSTDL